MTTKTISGYADGYSLNMSVYSELSITNTGSVGGRGVFLKSSGTVVNAGHVASTITDGIFMEGGGLVSNGGSVSGYIGVWAPNVSEGGGGGLTSVDNSGVIEGQVNGVQLQLGGAVNNSGTITETRGGDSTVISDAVFDLSGTVNNTGRIIASYNKAATNYHSGVDIGSGKLTNGTYQGALTALITGYYGVNATGTATVTNYATVKGVYAGVQLKAGGYVLNGDTYNTTALISGQINGLISATADVENFGTIEGGLRAVTTGGANLNNGFTSDFTALIEGGWSGVRTTAKTSNISNWGTIEATLADHYAVTLDGGTLTNGSAFDPGALIEASLGVSVDAGGTVVNDALIKGTYAGVTFYDGGRLTNGSAGTTTALIQADEGVVIETAAGTVANFATIQCLNLGGGLADGVYLRAGGAVTNGAVDDTAALITGDAGVLIGAAGTVANYGQISATIGAGVSIAGGGVVTNGAPTAPDALIEGLYGIDLGGAGAVTNLGTVTSSSAKAGAIELAAGGSVVNGASGDKSALARGAVGVSVAGAAGTVTNFATITGQNGAGVLAADSLTLANGDGADRAALIEGLNGIDVTSGTGTVRNFATIVGEGASGSFGVYLIDGGALTNGALSDESALIEGYGGVRILGSGSSVNFGVIEGLGGTGDDFGVNVGQASNMTNGAATDADALIEGYVGSELGGSSTMTNFGTILGSGGVAVKFINPNATLAIEAGSSLVGIVQGDGGHLDLASGSGTVTLLSAEGLDVSGVIPADTFDDIGTLEIGSGAAFALAAGGTIASGQGLVVDGVLTDAGTLTDGTGATLTLAGTLSGVGTLALTGGTATFEAGADLAIAKVTQSGASTASFDAASLTYAGVWSQSSGTLSVASGDRVNFSGEGDSFSGTLAGTGTIAFIGGADTFTSADLTATNLVVNGPTVTLGGALDLSGTMSVTTDDMIIASGGASLVGDGSLIFSDLATNKVSGGTLTNVNDFIKGAGSLGDGSMGLVNDAGGIIDGDDAVALAIDTGSSTITNAGTIEATSNGATTLASAVDNTGVLGALGGTLTVDDAVTGAGKAEINGGTADFAGAFSQNVAFIGSDGGTLELAHSEAYTGEISGFSKTGTTTLDLEDIAFVSGTTKASYSGTTTSGVLTVADGSHVAKITLEGNYTTSTFTLSSDGHGGTTVVDPARASAAPHAAAPLSPHPFIAAMASLGASGGTAHEAAQEWRAPMAPILARPTTTASLA